jgi:hypothetical protein
MQHPGADIRLPGTQADRVLFLGSDTKLWIWEKSMIMRGTLALLAATAAMSLASLAFAQDRYGSPMANYYDSSGALKFGSYGPDLPGNSGGNQNQASGNQNQAPVSRAQNTERPRGYSAYGYAPERNQRRSRQRTPQQ